MATRFADSFTVVRSAAGSPMPSAAEHVQHPRAVLSTAPREENFHQWIVLDLELTKVTGSIEETKKTETNEEFFGF